MRSAFSLLLLSALLLAGCAGARKATQHPAVGSWSYQIDTPEGPYTGTLTITQVDGVLGGMLIQSNGGGSTPLENVTFEDGRMRFEADTEAAGRVTGNVTVNGDTFEGTLNTAYYGAFPLKGTRQAPDGA